LYFESVGAAQERAAVKLFGWKRELVTRAINGLVKKRVLIEAEYPKQKGPWLALSELIK